ncbi:MAG: DNA-directed RNA polymerase subunit omega [bacterium]|nr:DNA-directed RNA polymerase subunit omega [bacterium]
MANKETEKKAPVSLTKKFPNRFLLTLAAAKRARQIKEGARPLIADEGVVPILTALEELRADKIEVSLDTPTQRNESLMDEIADLDLNNSSAFDEEEGAEPQEKKNEKKPKSKSKSLAA